MDFEEIFSKIQGLLKGADHTVGPLRKIKSRGGNEKQIFHIVAELHKLFIQYKYLDKNLEHLNNEMLRKVTFFLVLNCDLPDASNLANEQNVGHLVGICPLLTPCLLFDCIWGLNLGKYLCEILAYGPVTLSLELLKNISVSVGFSLPYPLLERVQMLVHAIYFKIFRIQEDKIYYMTMDHSLSSLDEKLIELLQNYISPESFKSDDWSINELYRYTGYAMKSILELTNDCIDLYIKQKPKILDCHKLYDIEYKIGAEFYVSPKTRHEQVCKHLTEINNCLLNACQANLKAINVTIYCSWCEFKLENSSETLQHCVATYAHIINEKLPLLNLPEEFFDELTAMFSSIAIKPLTLEEQIAQAGLDVILKNVDIENDGQQLWFKRFLELDQLLMDVNCFDLLKKHVKLCDIEDVHKLLIRVHSSQNRVINLDECKVVVLDALTALDTEDRLKVIITFHQFKNLSSFYEQSNFHENLIETFNKLVSDDDLNPILHLLIQNPMEVLRNLFEESFKSELKTDLVIKILRRIKQLCKRRVNESEEEPIGLHLLKKVCDHGTSKEFRQMVVYTLRKLTEEDIVSAELVAQDILFPNIYKFMVEKDFENVLLWLEGCQAICEQETFFKLYTPFILFLAQMLSHCRCDINTFALQSLSVLQLSINITKVVVKNVNSRNVLSKDDFDLIKDSLSTESTANRFYFEPLWSTENVNYLNYMFLGGLLQKSRSWIVSRLLELLPFSTLEEWKTLTINFLEEKPDALEYYRMLNDFISLLATVVKQSTSQASLACFECAIKHLTVILNDIILPNINDSYNAQLVVWENLLYMVTLFPQPIKENCCMQLIQILIVLLEKLKQKNSRVCSITVVDLMSLESTEACQLICKKITEQI